MATRLSTGPPVQKAGLTVASVLSAESDTMLMPAPKSGVSDSV
jgi:hypothetical protein